jgi:hypothetical protein
VEEAAGLLATTLGDDAEWRALATFYDGSELVLFAIEEDRADDRFSVTTVKQTIADLDEDGLKACRAISTPGGVAGTNTAQGYSSPAPGSLTVNAALRLGSEARCNV